MTTARELRAAMNAWDMHAIADHFAQDDGAQPVVVCEGVSVDVFNQYVGDGEGLKIGVRFLELTHDGRVLVVDLPSMAHEVTAGEFRWQFLDACGNAHEIRKSGSLTVHQHGHPHREADATYGPRPRTQHRNPAPPNRTLRDWVTLVVDVARFQQWSSLENAVRWWCGYDGVEYVLLIKISEEGQTLHFRLYDLTIALPPNGLLPPPVQVGSVTTDHAAPVYVTLDASRILAIPPNQPGLLPAGVNPEISVDMKAVRDAAVRGLRL